MDVQLPVVDNEDCKRAFSNKRASIDDRVLCAGFKTGGKDACQVFIDILNSQFLKNINIGYYLILG